MLTRIKLLVDDQPGALTRVIGSLKRSGFELENHRVARDQVSANYQIGLKLRGEPIPVTDLEKYLMSVDGVVEVSKIRVHPYDEIRRDARSFGASQSLAAAPSADVFTHLLSDELLAEITLSWAESGDAEDSMAVVDHLVAVYPLVSNAVARIEGVLRRHPNRNVLIRDFGVRVGRRVSAHDPRSNGLSDPALILDRLVIGYIFPFAKSWVVRDDSVNSEKEPLRLLVSESPFVYRRGNTTRLGSRRERCGYLEGLIEGVLQHSEAGSGIEIEETACIARGAKSCVFECRRRVELLQ